MLDITKIKKALKYYCVLIWKLKIVGHVSDLVWFSAMEDDPKPQKWCVILKVLLFLRSQETILTLCQSRWK